MGLSKACVQGRLFCRIFQAWIAEQPIPKVTIQTCCDVAIWAGDATRQGHEGVCCIATGVLLKC